MPVVISSRGDSLQVCDRPLEMTLVFLVPYFKQQLSVSVGSLCYVECHNKKTLTMLQQKDFTELYCVESSSTTCMIHGNYKSFWIQGVFGRGKKTFSI